MRVISESSPIKTRLSKDDGYPDDQADPFFENLLQQQEADAKKKAKQSSNDNSVPLFLPQNPFLHKITALSSIKKAKAKHRER